MKQLNMKWEKEIAFKMGVRRERKQTPTQVSMCLTRIVISKVTDWQRKYAIYQWQEGENPKDT